MDVAVSFRPGWQRRTGQLLLPAALLTLLNAAKPMTIDDVSYYYRAVQIAHHPLDPYGGEPFWDQKATPATGSFMPPGLSYWWAAAIRLFGDQEFLWKCWQFPFALLLVGALGFLLRRFAAGLEVPLLWLVSFSPAILPGWNQMLDLPALALGLTAVGLFLQAADNRRVALALLAGVVAGVAMQTKYTAVTAVAAFLLYGVIARRLPLALLAAGLAAALFTGCEIITYAKYGQSQFVLGVCWRGAVAGHVSWTSLVPPLVVIVGCVAPALVPLGLVALRARGRTIAWSLIALAVAYGVLALVPAEYASYFARAGNHRPRVYLNNLTVDLIGLPLWIIAAVVLWRHYLRRWKDLPADDRFLLLWLAIEILFYFPLSPFPAVRRIIGLTTVLTLLLGRVAARVVREEPHRWRQIQAATVLSVAAGLLFWGVDLYDSQAQKSAVGEVAAYIQPRQQNGSVWFTGYWGFQYYAHQAGMKPLVLGQSQLRPGDWLAIPRLEAGYEEPLRLDPRKAMPVAEFICGDWLPLCTQAGYYCGKHPLRHRTEPQVKTVVYRITADFVPPRPENAGDSPYLPSATQRASDSP